MMTKNFLASVLVLVGFGLPVSAGIVDYCGGSGCGTNNGSAFMTDLTTDGYTLGAAIDFTGILSDDTYTDGSGILFSSAEGLALSIVGGSLESPGMAGGGPEYIQISIPATIAAIQLTVTAQGGVCTDVYCPAFSNSVSQGFVGFINTNPTAPWVVDVGLFTNGNVLNINNFSVASSAGSETPEVATLVMIGAGLIAMRWMRRWPRRFFWTLQPGY
jgi:hypothetical protein